MSQIDEAPPARRTKDREQYWQNVVIPTAKGLEAFAWRVAWFAVLIKILFFV